MPAVRAGCWGLIAAAPRTLFLEELWVGFGLAEAMP